MKITVTRGGELRLLKTAGGWQVEWRPWAGEAWKASGKPFATEAAAQAHFNDLARYLEGPAS